jgi:hypothetical protein
MRLRLLWGPAFVTSLACFGTTAGYGQTSESDQVQALNQKIAAQANQLAEQQKEIQALQHSLEEQRTLLMRLVNASEKASEKPALPPAAAPAPAPPEPLHPLNPTVASSSSVDQSIATPATEELEKEEAEQPYQKTKHWYDKYTIRGYLQMRDNGLYDPNVAYKCDQCDKSIGDNNNLFLRRIRLVLSGNVSDHVSVYLQPDFASSSGTTLNFAQIRDAYFDVSFDRAKTNRIRAGQSKIPYGFEEMQSSSNRLDLDRTDALNSAFANERDLGVFYYWAPARIRARFNELVSKGLKGSGDFGVVGLGLFNGQILNTQEANNDLHYVGRYTYPFRFKGDQYLEASVQAYTGKYDVISRGANVKGVPNFRYDDRRVAVSLIKYPQPLGLQIEYNWGTGPKYNPATNFIDQKGLNGGYALLNYRHVFPHGIVVHPFLRFQYYNGGKKQEMDARDYLVREGDLGIEAQFGKYIELTPQYQKGDRTFEDSTKLINRQKGSLLRIQLQFNY